MFPRWLSLLFLAVLGLMLYHAGGMSRGGEAAKSEAPQAAPHYPEIAKTFDAEHWKKSLNPDYAALMKACKPPPLVPGTLGIKVTLDRVGEGSGAACGESVTLRVRRVDAAGRFSVEKSVTLTLGKSDVPGLDAALLGMKPGEGRTLVIPPVKGSIPSTLRTVLSPSQVSILSVSR